MLARTVGLGPPNVLIRAYTLVTTTQRRMLGMQRQHRQVHPVVHDHSVHSQSKAKAKKKKKEGRRLQSLYAPSLTYLTYALSLPVEHRP